MLKRLNSFGDTIVEVIVVLAVLGLAVSISYATANRSLLNDRQAQENAEATQLAQSQVENLYNYVAGNGLPTGNQFCFDPGTNNFDSNISNCNFASIPYNIVITNCDFSPAPANCSGTTPATDTFIIFAKWPDVLGDPNPDTVTLTYRVHPLP